MPGREVEMTFSVELADVEDVYSAFTLRSAADQERRFGASPELPRTVLHFYLKPAPGEHVRRVRVRRRQDKYAISLESKHVTRDDLMLVEKEEVTIEQRLPLRYARQMMLGNAAIVCSFIKNQHRIWLKSSSGTLKVSLDQVIPFRADQPTTLAPQFWHLEIEQWQGWPVPEFLASDFFRQNLSAALRPLQHSKWELARMSSPTSLGSVSARHFKNYLAAIFREGKEQRFPALAGRSSDPASPLQ